MSAILDVLTPLHDLVDQAEESLSTDPEVYQRSGELVHVSQSAEGQWLFRPIKANMMGYLLSRVAKWTRGSKRVHPPSGVVKALVDKGNWPHVRSIRSVVPFPPIMSNGYIPYHPGYNQLARIFFTPDNLRFRVPERPTQSDAQEAAQVLLDLVCDFPFLSPPHASAWIAGLLGPITRFAHNGNIPLVLVQANSPRVGKTTLVKVISHILLGEECPVVTHSHSETEERKRILSYLRTGRNMILVDNVVGQFGGATINALATSRFFEDRILGQTKILQVPNDTVWFITGNNMTLAPDTAERCLNVRLHTSDERPHLRSGFRYPELLTTAHQYRDRLLSAALTLVRAYIVAGKPRVEMEPWGGFESWSHLVRGALIWSGLPDPAITRHELEEEADIGRYVAANLVEGWSLLQEEVSAPNGLTSFEVCELLATDVEAKLLRDSLSTMLGRVSCNPHSLELTLRQLRERNFSGKCLRCIDNSWSVQTLNGP
jgi:hypothetical protein